jgi:predicted DNA-binding protein (MmcQ/YjbR family)
MNFETAREFCLALPFVTEKVQWDNDLLLCIGGKMFAVLALEAPATHRLSFKCTPEEFAELVERDGIDPAPYVARYHWVTLQRWGVLTETELKGLLQNSYEMVKAKLPKKVLAGLGSV